MTSKPGPLPSPGKSMAETYLLAMRCPVLRRRDSHSGFCTELENLDGDGKGKDAMGGGGEKIVSIVADVNRWSPPQCKRRMT
jgi:hypothetical protein